MSWEWTLCRVVAGTISCPHCTGWEEREMREGSSGQTPPTSHTCQEVNPPTPSSPTPSPMPLIALKVSLVWGSCKSQRIWTCGQTLLTAKATAHPIPRHRLSIQLSIWECLLPDWDQEKAIFVHFEGQVKRIFKIFFVWFVALEAAAVRWQGLLWNFNYCPHSSAEKCIR